MVLSSSRRLSHTAATAPWVSVMIGAPAERHSSAGAAALSNGELSRTKIAAAVCYSGWFGEYPLQLREPDRPTGLLGHRDESPGEPPEPGARVDVVGRPGRDLRRGVVSAVDAADGVPE